MKLEEQLLVERDIRIMEGIAITLQALFSGRHMTRMTLQESISNLQSAKEMADRRINQLQERLNGSSN